MYNLDEERTCLMLCVLCYVEYEQGMYGISHNVWYFWHKRDHVPLSGSVVAGAWALYWDELIAISNRVPCPTDSDGVHVVVEAAWSPDSDGVHVVVEAAWSPDSDGVHVVV